MTCSKSRRWDLQGGSKLASGAVSFMHRWHSPLLSIAAIMMVWRANAYTLQVRVQPGRAFGGEAFLEQPQVEILEGDGGDIYDSFEVRKSHSQPS